MTSKKQMQEKKCLFCKNVFLPSTGTQKFCCASCREEWYLKKNKQILEKKKCLNCKEIYQPQNKKQKFCNISCRRNYFSTHNKKIPNPIKDLQKLCSVKSCKKKGRGIINKKFYCKKHFAEFKQNQGIRQYHIPKLST